MHLYAQRKSISMVEKYFNGYPDTRSVQENFNLIASFIQDSADKHIPSKTSRTVSSVPWITSEIIRKIRRRNKIHAKAKKTGSKKTIEVFRPLKGEEKLVSQLQKLNMLRNLMVNLRTCSTKMIIVRSHFSVGRPLSWMTLLFQMRI